MRPLLTLTFVLACARSPAAPPPPVAPAASAPAPALVETVLRPEAVDPAADRWLEDQLAVVDHRAPSAGRLVVYLNGAGGKPRNVRTMVLELAAMGFHVVAPMYATDYGITKVCAPAAEPDDDCHRKVRQEAFEGEDRSPHVTITRANSAEERVARMLARLGWSQFLDGPRPRWEEIVVAGHSHGASSAGLIGKLRRVHRVVMLSGPFDNRAGTPAAWTRLDPKTPVDRFFGFSHVAEGQHRGHLADWEAMGLGGAPVVAETAAPPYGGAHQLVTALAAPAGKDPHGATAAGGASPKDADGRYVLAPAWRYLFGR